jgi:hypothetical protein
MFLMVWSEDVRFIGFLEDFGLGMAQGNDFSACKNESSARWDEVSAR